MMSWIAVLVGGGVVSVWWRYLGGDSLGIHRGGDMAPRIDVSGRE